MGCFYVTFSEITLLDTTETSLDLNDAHLDIQISLPEISMPVSRAPWEVWRSEEKNAPVSTALQNTKGTTLPGAR